MFNPQIDLKHVMDLKITLMMARFLSAKCVFQVGSDP